MMRRRCYKCVTGFIVHRRLARPYVIFGFILLLIGTLQIWNVFVHENNVKMVSGNMGHPVSWIQETLAKNYSIILRSTRSYAVSRTRQEHKDFTNRIIIEPRNQTEDISSANKSLNIRIQSVGATEPESLRVMPRVIGRNGQHNLSIQQMAELRAKREKRAQKVHALAISKINFTLLRNDTCNGCFKQAYNYIVSGDSICKGTKDIQLVFLITTAHAHFKRREILRRTWLTLTGNSSAVKYVFLLGQSSDPNLRSLVKEESYAYRDIVIADFLDSYLNLTYKTMMGLKWATTMCPQARYLMKTDDDMFINIPELLKLLNSPKAEKILETSIMGKCWKGKPIRNIKSKYYASYEAYPHFNYPHICSGTGYVMSMRTAKQINNVSPNIPFYHLEDVYIGICLKVLGLKTFSHNRFSMSFRVSARSCYNIKRMLVISVHTRIEQQLKFLWNPRPCRQRQRARGIPIRP